MCLVFKTMQQKYSIKRTSLVLLPETTARLAYKMCTVHYTFNVVLCATGVPATVQTFVLVSSKKKIIIIQKRLG